MEYFIRDSGLLYKKFNVGSGEIVECQRFSKNIRLTSDRPSYAVGETATVTARIDDCLNHPLKDVFDVTLALGDQSTVATTVNGEATFPISSDVAGTFTLMAVADLYNSGKIEVTYE